MLNRVILIGRLVADPELRVTPGGISVATFRIAVDRNFKNQQGEYDTDFFNIVTWRKLAEVVSKNIGKGRLVGVDGILQSRQYQNKEGQNRTVVEVVADRVQFLDRPRSSGGGGGSSQESYAPSDENVPPGDESSGQTKDDLPF
jgi:single-strand DNA-binding protein